MDSVERASRVGVNCKPERRKCLYFYSVAGNSQSPDLAYVTVQPFVTLHLPAALFLSSDATMKFYWQGGQSTVLVNIGFGHAFGAHFVGSVRGWYTVADADRSAVKVEIVLGFQPGG